LPDSPFLYPILDLMYSDDLLSDSYDAIRAGAQILQIRAKKLSKRSLFELVQTLLPVCIENHVLLIVNDAVDVALLSGASGVHLGQEDFPVEACRKILVDKIIGYSTHNWKQWQAANRLPVDYVAIGPVYPSATKPQAGEALGLSMVRDICAQKRVPVVCIGGIRRRDFQDLIACGADGIAVISELYQHRNMHDAVSELLQAVRNA